MAPIGCGWRWPSERCPARPATVAPCGRQRGDAPDAAHPTPSWLRSSTGRPRPSACAMHWPRRRSRRTIAGSRWRSSTGTEPGTPTTCARCGWRLGRIAHEELGDDEVLRESSSAPGSETRRAQRVAPFRGVSSGAKKGLTHGRQRSPAFAWSQMVAQLPDARGVNLIQRIAGRWRTSGGWSECSRRTGGRPRRPRVGLIAIGPTLARRRRGGWPRAREADRVVRSAASRHPPVSLPPGPAETARVAGTAVPQGDACRRRRAESPRSRSTSSTPAARPTTSTRRSPPMPRNGRGQDRGPGHPIRHGGCSRGGYRPRPPARRRLAGDPGRQGRHRDRRRGGRVYRNHLASPRVVADLLERK